MWQLSWVTSLTCRARSDHCWTASTYAYSVVKPAAAAADARPRSVSPSALTPEPRCAAE